MKTNLVSKSTLHLSLALTVLAPLVGFNRLAAQQTPSENTPATSTADKPKEKVSMLEGHSIRKIAKATDEDLRISRIAQTRATAPEVKELAKRMVSEMEPFNSELNTLAVQKSVEVNTPVNDKLERKWNEKDAKDFDSDYIDQICDDQESVVKDLQKRSDTKDADLAAFSRKNVPAAQERLQLAQGLKKSHK